MQTHNEKRKALNIKVNAPLHAKLQHWAKKENRTINNAVETLLMKAVEMPQEL